jgi:hypothetical protein
VITVHIADKPLNGVQRCFRCNWILTDNRRAMAPEGKGLSWWKPGAFVHITHDTFPVSYAAMDRDAIGDDEKQCECPPIEVDGGPPVAVYQ